MIIWLLNSVATMRSRTSRTPTRELDVTDVRIKATLNDVSLELTTVKEPLLKASASGLTHLIIINHYRTTELAKY